MLVLQEIQLHHKFIISVQIISLQVPQSTNSFVKIVTDRLALVLHQIVSKHSNSVNVRTYGGCVTMLTDSKPCPLHTPRKSTFREELGN